MLILYSVVSEISAVDEVQFLVQPVGAALGECSPDSVRSPVVISLGALPRCAGSVRSPSVRPLGRCSIDLARCLSALSLGALPWSVQYQTQCAPGSARS